MNIAELLDSLDRISYAADAIEAITMPETIDELGGERIHAGLFFVLSALRAEIRQAERNIKRNVTKERT